MKEIRGSATVDVAGSPDECLALLRDIEGYPSWYPKVVRRVEIVRPAENDGPVLAQTTVHLGIGPVRRDFDLLMEISSAARRVIRLARVGHDQGDPEELSATWRIEDGTPQSRTALTLEVSARLEVPRLLPLHGLGDAIAQDWVSAAARALETP